MTALDELNYNAKKRVLAVCVDNQAKINLIPEAVIEQNNLIDIMDDVEDAKGISLLTTAEITAIKDSLREAMVETVFDRVLYSAVKAGQVDLPKLELLLSIPKSSITQLDDTLIGTRCQELYKIMDTNAAVLTNLKPADFTAMQAAIKAFNDANGSPKDIIEKRKIFGNKLIHQLLIKADKPEENLIKIFKSQIKESADAIISAARIGRPVGSRYTSIVLSILDSVGLMALRKVKCTLTNGTDTVVKYSTAKGNIRFYSLPNALWTATLEYPDYQTYYQKDIATVEKNILRISINLVKNAPPDDPSVDPDVTTGSLTTLVYFKNNEEPAAGAQNSIQSANYVGTTDEDGEDYCGELKVGTIQGVIFMEGYIPVPYTIEIKAGENVIQKIYLEPVTAPDNPTPDS